MKELRRISWIPSNKSSWQGPLTSSLGGSAEYYLIGLINFLSESVFRIYSVAIFDLTRTLTACTRTFCSLTFSVIVLIM